MQEKYSFNCYLIGEGNLLIECAEILLRHQHQVRGIISPDKTVARWANENNIICLKTPQQLARLLEKTKCDYLFSIVNHSIVAPKILNLVGKAINYHDAPLPRYAGVNASAWAIINGEKQHGITWHEMAAEIDTGNIIKQTAIDLEPGETALSLSLKCYQAAIAAFTELIAELANNQVTLTPQCLQQRSYYGRHQKPQGLGIIDFEQPATVIDNLVRGLNFGNYPNPLTTAKLLLNSAKSEEAPSFYGGVSLTDDLDYVIVTKAQILPTQSSHLPGTIIEIQADRLIVATASQDIALQSIISKQGISIEILAEAYQLKQGQRLPKISAELSAEIVKLASEVASSERYWCKQLAQRQYRSAFLGRRNVARVAPPFALTGMQKLNKSIGHGRVSRPSLNFNQTTGKDYQRVKLPLSSTVIDSIQKTYRTSTLKEVIAAVWGIYLARLSGNQQITLGFETKSDRRLTPWFANCLPVNLKIAPEQNFAAVVEAIAQKRKLNQKHQTYATDLIPRSPNLANKPQNFAIIIAQDTQPDCLLSDLIVTSAQSDNFGARSLGDVPSPGSLLFLSYNAEVFSSQQIALMLEQWQTLVEEIAKYNDCPVSQLSLISASVKQRLLKDWNQTADYPTDICLHQLFEARVVEDDNAIAVVCQGKSLTRGELNRRANQLAHHLQQLGVQPETLVGVCLERSLEMAIAVFAVLKAGGAYVPLDPNYPTARLNYLLKDAQVDVLLTQAKIRERLPEIDSEIICLDRWDNQTLKQTNPSSLVKSNNLAYVIYTSGSTGNPKGVAIEHHSAVNTLFDLEERFTVQPQDRVLAVSSLSFDLSVYDLFGVLGSGGTVVVPQPANYPDPEHWLELIEQEQVTIWNSAPALLELLVNYIISFRRQIPPSLRLILLSGDRINPNLVVQLQHLNPHGRHELGGFPSAAFGKEYSYPTPWLEMLGKPQPPPRPKRADAKARPQLQIVSLGGATEASIWSICYPITQTWSAEKTIPYGRPLHNQSFYILDAQKQLVPVGVTGELYIGGVGVARGYLHRPELTASKFIPNPFLKQTTVNNGDRGDRLYKTGDLGRYFADGNIEFLGRIDNQVKIRGVRIELGEIEATLLKCPEIQEALTIVNSSHADHSSLVAYSILKPNSTLTSQQLRDFLKTQLPEFAIPAALIFLDAFPLTPNGKVDLKALPKTQPKQLKVQSPASISEQTAQVGVLKDTLSDKETSPNVSSSLEGQLSQIWSRILNVRPIAHDDNFFELGGNSLLALRLFEQIQKVYAQNLPLATLFAAPTIAQLAQVMRDRGCSAPWSVLVNIQPLGTKPPLFCIHPVGGNVLSYYPLAAAMGTDRPFYGVQARGLDGQQTLSTSIEAMAADYLREIKLIQPQGPYYLSGYSFGGFVAYEMALRLEKNGEKVAMLALFDCLGPNCAKKYPLSQQIQIHLNNLAQLSIIESLGYLRTRITGSLSKLVPTSIQEQYFKLITLFLTPKQRSLAILEHHNYKLIHQYRKCMSQVYGGKISLFRAKVRTVEGYYDPIGGWDGLTLAGVDVYEVPGDHLQMVSQPEIASILVREMNNT